MPRYAGILTTFVQLDPKAAGTVPVGSLFIDSTSNQATVKPTDDSPPASIPIDYFLKPIISGAAYGQNAALSRLSSGKVVASDADVNASNHIGYAVDASTGDGEAHTVFLIGPNLAGFLSGLGFTSGQVIYLDKNAGQLVADVSSFAITDGIVKVGIADCAAGIATSVATDLISNNQPVSLA